MTDEKRVGLENSGWIDMSKKQNKRDDPYFDIGMIVMKEIPIQNRHFYFVEDDFFVVRYREPQKWYRKRIVLGASFSAVGEPACMGLSINLPEARRLLRLLSEEIERVEREPDASWELLRDGEDGNEVEND